MLDLGAGTPTYRAAKAALVSPTQGDLYTNWVTSAGEVIGVTDADLTNSVWETNAGIFASGINVGRVAGDLYGVICREDLSASELSDTEDYLKGLY